MPEPTVIANLRYKGDLLLDLSLPQRGDELLPLVVWIHGGGWCAGNKDERPVVRAVDEYLLAHGYAIAAINYRLSDVAPWPAQLEDARAAIRWLRANAETYGLDPQRVGAWGFSAGGHLGALLALDARVPGLDDGPQNSAYSSKVQAVCAFAAPTDLAREVEVIEVPEVAAYAEDCLVRLMGGPQPNARALRDAASPVYYVHPDGAPFLLISGEIDPLVRPSQMYEMDAALREANVPVTSYLVPQGDHGMAGLPQDEIDHINEMVRAFFDRYL